MEAFIFGFLNKLLTLEGAGWLFAVLGLGIAYLLWKELRANEADRRKETKEWQESQKEVFKERLAEQKVLISTVESISRTMAGLSASVEARSQVTGELSKGFSVMVSAQEANKDYFRGVADRLEVTLRDLNARAERTEQLIRAMGVRV